MGAGAGLPIDGLGRFVFPVSLILIVVITIAGVGFTAIKAVQWARTHALLLAGLITVAVVLSALWILIVAIRHRFDRHLNS